MSQPAKRPNLLYVFADQMRGMDMRCAGNPDVITPVLDRMAREGVRATHHYATIPLCSPNRGTLLTGTYPTTHKLLYNDTPVRDDLPTLGTVCRDAGYRCGYVGKWHIQGGDREAPVPAGPRRLGFDDFWKAHNCHYGYFDPNWYEDDNDQPTQGQGFEPILQTDHAIEFLDGQQDRDNPFCLVVSWGPPHNPYEQIPASYQDMYDPSKLLLRPNTKHIPREILDVAWSQRITTRDYYAHITCLDQQLGRLLAKLEALGVADDTIVIFTSDHGDMLWSQGLMYKRLPHEESASVPFVMRWPAGLKPAVNDTLMGTVDDFPTLAAMMGLPLPDTIEGCDLSRHFERADHIDAPAKSKPSTKPTPEPKSKDAGKASDKSCDTPSSVFLANYGRYVYDPERPVPDWRGIRTSRYTYSETPDRKPYVVFDNDDDPYQMNNLAETTPDHPAIPELARELDAWLKSIGDPFLEGKAMAAACGV